MVHRAGVVVLGVFIVLAGIVMSGPGVPGPGIAVIIIGLTFLALEFDRAERLLERMIRWGERAAERAEATTPRQRLVATVLGVLAAGGLRGRRDPLGHPADADPLGGASSWPSARAPARGARPGGSCPVSVLGRSSTNSISRG